MKGDSSTLPATELSTHLQDSEFGAGGTQGTSAPPNLLVLCAPREAACADEKCRMFGRCAVVDDDKTVPQSPFAFSNHVFSRVTGTVPRAPEQSLILPLHSGSPRSTFGNRRMERLGVVGFFGFFTSCRFYLPFLNSLASRWKDEYVWIRARACAVKLCRDPNSVDLKNMMVGNDLFNDTIISEKSKGVPAKNCHPLFKLFSSARH